MVCRTLFPFRETKEHLLEGLPFPMLYAKINEDLCHKTDSQYTVIWRLFTEEMAKIPLDKIALYRIRRDSLPKPYGEKAIIDNIITFILIDELTI